MGLYYIPFIYKLLYISVIYCIILYYAIKLSDLCLNVGAWYLLILYLYYCFLVLLAIIIPFLDILISLIGSLCLSVVGIALPAIVNHVTFIEKCKKDSWEYYIFSLRNFLIVLIAIYSLVIGVYQNTLQIMDAIAIS